MCACSPCALVCFLLECGSVLPAALHVHINLLGTAMAGRIVLLLCVQEACALLQHVKLALGWGHCGPVVPVSMLLIHSVGFADCKLEGYGIHACNLVMSSEKCTNGGLHPWLHSIRSPGQCQTVLVITTSWDPLQVSNGIILDSTLWLTSQSLWCQCLLWAGPRTPAQTNARQRRCCTPPPPPAPHCQCLPGWSAPVSRPRTPWASGRLL